MVVAVKHNYQSIFILAGILALVLILEFGAAYAFYHALDAQHQQRLLELLAPHIELLLELKILAIALLAIAIALLWQPYFTGIRRISEGVHIILGSNPQYRLELTKPAAINTLAQAVNALAAHSATLAENLSAKVAEAKSSVEEEKNRLAALMSQLSQGVLVCNNAGRILFYNQRTRQILDAPGSTTFIGLGRSVSAFIERSLLEHALENIRVQMHKQQAHPKAQFVITTHCAQWIRVSIVPVRAVTPTPPASSSGFILTLENITNSFEVDATRDMLLHSFTEGSRAALGNIRAAVETLLYYPDCEVLSRDRFLQVIHEETCHLSTRLDQVTAEHADSLKTRWPLEEMLAVDLIAAAQRRIQSRLHLDTQLQTPEAGLWIKADSYTLVQALTYLAGRLQTALGIEVLQFHLRHEARIAQLDLLWEGAGLPQYALQTWEEEPMSSGAEDSPLSLRDVLERHAAELVYMLDAQRQQPLLRWLLPLAEPSAAPAADTGHYDVSRPEFYDFDLFNQAGQTPELDERRLSELAYTVFDTETTGLNPSAGDEIISIGAVRIVNNRLLRYDTYEQLVDPQRPIDPVAETIHGISNAMLRGRPLLGQILPQFHAYCADAVLVGHNSAFDMRFLQLKEEETGVRFTQPLLDTLLLSEVLHPHQETHSLEAIAERLGVEMRDRHTALGDALVTGEVFLRMIPLLAAQGITTLGAARAATEKIYQKVRY